MFYSVHTSVPQLTILSAMLMIILKHLGSWYGQGLLWPCIWPAGHTTWSPVSTDSVDPPTFPTPLYVALVILQAVFKISLKTSS